MIEKLKYWHKKNIQQYNEHKKYFRTLFLFLLLSLILSVLSDSFFDSLILAKITKYVVAFTGGIALNWAIGLPEKKSETTETE